MSSLLLSIEEPRRPVVTVMPRQHARLSRISQLGALGLALLAVIGSGGCGRRSVAKIGSFTISEREYNDRVQQHRIELQGQPPVEVGYLVLSQMVTENMMKQLAKDEGVYPTDKELRDRVEIAKKKGLIPNDTPEKQAEAT